MNVRSLTMVSAGIFLLGILAATAQAAPIGTAVKAKFAGGGAASTVEKAGYRRCWRRGAAGYCRWRSRYNTYYRQSSESAPRVMLGIAF